MASVSPVTVNATVSTSVVPTIHPATTSKSLSFKYSIAGFIVGIVGFLASLTIHLGSLQASIAAGGSSLLALVSLGMKIWHDAHISAAAVAIDVANGAGQISTAVSAGQSIASEAKAVVADVTKAVEVPIKAVEKKVAAKKSAAAEKATPTAAPVAPAVPAK